MYKYIFQALVLFYFILPVSAISEKDFFDQYNKKVFPFYESCEQGFFFGSENKRINYLKYEAEKKDTAVIVLPGKSESYIKYAELIYDLKDPGMSFYLLDHRGMGFSERSFDNDRDKVFVKKFDYYVKDLKKFVGTVVDCKKYKNLFLISHSMGGTVAALYLESFPDDFDGAIFAAPMIKLNTGIFSEKTADLMTNLLIFLGRGNGYCITQGKSKPENFKNNQLTSSKNRWNLWENKILFEYPEIISGGATNRWVNESLKACRKVLKNKHKIKIPMLIFQAENDDIVKKEGIDVLCEAEDCKKVILKDSKHEIFMERDSIRDLALQQVLDFINEKRSKDKAKTF